MVGKPSDYRGLCEIDVLENADAASDAAVIAARIGKCRQRDTLCAGRLAPARVSSRDFCILLRGRQDFAVYEAALRAAEIPVYADVAADLLDAPHIGRLQRCCVWLINPARMWSLQLCCSARCTLYAG